MAELQGQPLTFEAGGPVKVVTLGMLYYVFQRSYKIQILCTSFGAGTETRLLDKNKFKHSSLSKLSQINNF